MEGEAGDGGTHKKSSEFKPEVIFFQIKEPELEVEALTPSLHDPCPSYPMKYE